MSKVGKYIRTEEIRKKNRDSKKGKRHTEETKRKIGEALKGRKHSEETKRKMSEAKKGRIVSLEARKRMSITNRGRRPMLGKHHSLETRKRMSETKRGDKNPFWRGGICQNPYSVDWTKTLRQSIRERDKYTCQICREKQGDKTLSVHHIDYNKKDNNSDNLISLCNSCHTKTNYNRNYWIRYFNL